MSIIKRYWFLSAMLLLSGTLSAQITSTFNANAEGWTTPNDADATITYSATGGNPGGLVSGTPFFFVGGAGTVYFPFYFVAPTVYYGNRSAYYNGTLRYDIQPSSIAGVPNLYAEVVIANSLGITLYYFPTVSNLPPAAPTWTTYSVTLNNLSGFWKTTNNATGPAATEVQLQSVLGDLASLQIRGLYRDANTTNRLDNVSFRPPIVVTAQPISSTICNGVTTTLTTAATGNPAITYQWQRETSPSVWGNVTNTGGYGGATTASLSINTTGNFGAGNYRCRISGLAVDDAFTSTAIVTINSLPTAPTTTGSASCGSASLVLSAAGGAAGQYRWYTVPTGGTPIAGQTNSTYSTPVLTGTTTYYVAINNGTCESTRAAVVATINTLPTAPTTTGASSCGTASVTLSAAGGAAGQYRWYTVPTGGVAIAGQTNSTYVTPALTITTTFHVSINNGTCESTRTTVIATINTQPAAPVTTGAAACSTSSVTLSATGGTSGQYRWYTMPTGGTAISGETNSSFITPTLTVSTTYYVAINNGTCESSRTPVIASISEPGCGNLPPVIQSVPATTHINGKITLNLVPLISDSDNNTDFSTLAILSPPSSGASAFIDNAFNLIIDYAGISFTGIENITIEVCDIFSACTAQIFSIEVVGDIEIFNGMSPNTDGKNEIFLIKNIDLLPETKKNTVKIFNRWGSLVFETNDYDNTTRVFRGLSNDGKILPTGTYFYKIEFETNPSKNKAGYISLKH